MGKENIAPVDTVAESMVRNLQKISEAMDELLTDEEIIKHELKLDAQRKYMKIYRNSNKEHLNLQRRLYNKRNTLRLNQRAKLWRKNNPEKIKAHWTVGHAIQKGLLQPAKNHTCICCGKQAEHYHHFKGYSVENILEVVPVCVMCHRNWRD